MSANHDSPLCKCDLCINNPVAIWAYGNGWDTIKYSLHKIVTLVETQNYGEAIEECEEVCKLSKEMDLIRKIGYIIKG